MYQFKNKNGMSLIGVTIALMLLIILSLVSANLISTKAEISSNSLNAKRALYVAETGLAIAKHTLSTDWSLANNPANFPPRNLGNGSYITNVSLDEINPNTAYIHVQGFYGQSRREISSEVTFSTSGGIQYAIHSNGDVTLDGTGGGSYGGVEVYYGEVLHSGDLQEIERVSYEYGASSRQEHEAIPGIDIASAIARAQANNSNGYNSNYFTGELPDDNPPESLNGVIFIDRTGSNPASATLPSHIMTEGNDDYLTLIVMGDLDIEMDVTIRGLVYVTGDVTLSGNSIIEGSLIAEGDIRIEGDIPYTPAMICYHPNYLSNDAYDLVANSGGLEELSWTETFTASSSY